MEVATLTPRKEVGIYSDSPSSTAPTQASSSNDHVAAGSGYIDNGKSSLGNPPRPFRRNLRRRNTLSPPKKGMQSRKTLSRKGYEQTSGGDESQAVNQYVTLEKLHAASISGEGASFSPDGVESEDESSSLVNSSRSGGKSSKGSPVVTTMKHLSRVARRLRVASGGDATTAIGRMKFLPADEGDGGTPMGLRRRGGSVDALSRNRASTGTASTTKSPRKDSSDPGSPRGLQLPRVPHRMVRGVTVPASLDGGVKGAGTFGGDRDIRGEESAAKTTEGVRGGAMVGLRRRLSRKRGKKQGRSKSPSPSRASRSRSRSPFKHEVSKLSGGLPASGDGDVKARDCEEMTPASGGADLGHGAFEDVPVPGLRPSLRPPAGTEGSVLVDGPGKRTVKHTRGFTWHSGSLDLPRSDCFIVAPPSTLKYGDRLRLWARPSAEDQSDRLGRGSSSGRQLEVLLEGSQPLHPQKDERRGAKGLWRGKVTGGVVEGKKRDKAGLTTGSAVGGYVGSRNHVQRELLRRSEVVVIGRSHEDEDYSDCHFRAVDPDGQRQPGDAVCFGDLIFLVDDRSMTWSENTHGLSGTLRMKAEGSPRNVAVSFRLPQSADSPGLLEDGKQPVVFGRDGVQIFTEELDGKVHSKRKRGSKKRGLALSAYRKNGDGVVGGIVCMDSRGTPLVFELHLPSVSARGDPSPVVTEVTIHPAKRLSLELLNTPPRPPSFASGGESSLSTASSGTLSYSTSLDITRASSAPRMGKLRSDQSLREEDLPSSELDLEVLEGLKWGEFVRFRMPCDEQVEPNHLMLTLRLSNKTLVSLTSQELRARAGKGEFQVVAHEQGASTSARGTGDQDAAGVVMVKCELSPVTCPTEELRKCVRLKGVGEGLAGTSLWDTSWSLVGRFWRLVGRLGPKVLPFENDYSSKVLSREQSPNGGGVSTSLASWLKFSPCSLLCLFVVAMMTVVISPLRRPCTSVWDLRKPDGSAYPRVQLAAAAAAFDEAGTLRGPGMRKFMTVYSNVDSVAPEGWSRIQSTPSLDEAGSQREAHPSFNSIGLLDDEGARDGRAGSEEEPGREARGEDAFGMSTRVAGPSQDDLGGAREASEERSARELIGGTGRAGGGHGDGMILWPRSQGWRSLTLAVTVVMLVIMGLFGLEWSTRSTASDEPRPMQAQVQLLRWRAGGIVNCPGTSTGTTGVTTTATPTATVASSLEGTYVDPPSDSDLPPMPYRFMLAENLDAEKAWQRWRNTVLWRKENGADEVLSKPHPKYTLIKSKYAHCFHLPDKDGRLTYYERPGASEMAELKKLGVTRRDLTEHYMYCMEYLWQVLQPSQTQRITVVIDLAGVRLMDIAGESVSFLRSTVGMLSKHYPQRSFKILILNAPSFFNTIFSMVKPLLNEATKKKIDLLTPAQATSEMLKVIPSENLPVQYGGTCEVPLMQSAAEASLLAHTEKILEENGTGVAGEA